MMCPSAAVMVSSGPIGVAPCDTQGSISTPSKRTPTAPSSTTSSSEEQRRGAARGARRGEAADQRHGRSGLGEEPQNGVGGERGRVGEQDRAVGALQIRHAGQRAGALLELLHDRVERRGRAAVELRRPDRHGGALLDLASRADHAARGAADELARGECLVDRLQHRLGRREVRAGGEHDREIARLSVETFASTQCGLQRPGALIRARGQAGADPHGHSVRRYSAAVQPLLSIVALFGPTGVGKTAVAIALAERLRAEGEDPVAVSADALQVYRGLETLTGAATAAEQQQLEHRLIGFLPVDAPFSAGEYARLAHAEIDGLLAEGRRPIVVGGTGLYLRAALAELDLRPPVPAAIRERRRDDLARRGPEALHAELAQLAPHAAATMATTDAQRIVRALELLDAGHQPPAGEQLWTTDTRHPTLLAGLTMEREALKQRIGERVDAMIAAGARAEVEQAALQGASTSARKALGFRELLAGDVEAMKTATRRYARRQLTWMRKLPDVHLTDVTGRAPDDVAEELHRALT